MLPLFFSEEHKNLFFMFFRNPRTIKPRARAQSNPEQCKISYKIPILHQNLQNMKNSSNSNQHEKTNPEKSSNLQPRNLQPRTSSNNTPIQKTTNNPPSTTPNPPPSTPNPSSTNPNPPSTRHRQHRIHLVEA